MRSKLLLGGLFASVMILPVLAQQSPPVPAAPAATRAQTTTTAPMATTAQWRASKLVGLNVYNDQNEKLGDINEILLDQAGKVHGVVIGVGGFLGMGEREIIVTMDKLKFVNEPVRMSATTTSRPATTTTTTAPATTTTGAPVTQAERGPMDRPATTTTVDRPAATTTTTTARPVRAANENWYPDHAILSGATKDSLKSMPEFRYN